MSYFEFLGQYGDRILSGTLVTVVLTVLASSLAIAIALAAGLIGPDADLTVGGRRRRPRGRLVEVSQRRRLVALAHRSLLSLMPCYTR